MGASRVRVDEIYPADGPGVVGGRVDPGSGTPWLGARPPDRQPRPSPSGPYGLVDELDQLLADPVALGHAQLPRAGKVLEDSSAAADGVREDEQPYLVDEVGVHEGADELIAGVDDDVAVNGRPELGQ